MSRRQWRIVAALALVEVVVVVAAYLTRPRPVRTFRASIVLSIGHVCEPSQLRTIGGRYVPTIHGIGWSTECPPVAWGPGMHAGTVRVLDRCVAEFDADDGAVVALRNGGPPCALPIGPDAISGAN